METIGELLRSHREALGISQVSAGELFGVKQATYNRWENEESTPADYQWESIREILKIKETEFGLALLASGRLRDERRQRRGR